jgi:hypothetical protein
MNPLQAFVFPPLSISNSDLTLLRVLLDFKFLAFLGEGFVAFGWNIQISRKLVKPNFQEGVKGRGISTHAQNGLDTQLYFLKEHL